MVGNKHESTDRKRQKEKKKAIGRKSYGGGTNLRSGLWMGIPYGVAE